MLCSSYHPSRALGNTSRERFGSMHCLRHIAPTHKTIISDASGSNPCSLMRGMGFCLFLLETLSACTFCARRAMYRLGWEAAGTHRPIWYKNAQGACVCVHVLRVCVPETMCASQEPLLICMMRTDDGNGLSRWAPTCMHPNARILDLGWSRLPLLPNNQTTVKEDHVRQDV